MSRRKKAYTPKSFESINGNRLSANMYATMLQSKAWKKLNKGAMVLYLYMKLQYYGARNIADHPQTDFVFNKAMVTQVYGLYTNMSQFRKDRDLLIEYGFIEYVENGKNTRTKSIYRFSDKWQQYK